jgi:hypothetical protein
MRQLRESDLPFKVKRLDKPQIVHKRNEEGNLGGDYHRSYKDKIYIYPHGKEDDIEYTETHEVAHYQLDDRRTRDEKSLLQRGEDEIQADLLTYARIGKPIDYSGRWVVIGENLLEYIDRWEVPLSNKKFRVLGVLQQLYNKYKSVMPKQWVDDYKVVIQDKINKKYGITPNILSRLPSENSKKSTEYYEVQKLVYPKKRKGYKGTPSIKGIK